MCGIIAYTGKEEAYEILLEGLKTLQYRGYDSAGIAVTGKNGIKINKSLILADLSKKTLKGTAGIGHTRWATKGEVTVENAHPFIDCKNEIALVHNGTIDNYLEIKSSLKNHNFNSETDSEAILHLIEDNYSGDLKDAVRKATDRLKGTYALGVIHKVSKEVVVTKREKSLVIGVGKNQALAASDSVAMAGNADKIAYLDEEDIAVLSPDGIKVYDKNMKEKTLKFEKPSEKETATKGTHNHYMLKEIKEQPEIIKRLFEEEMCLRTPGRVFLVACGTAYHAALIGKYLLEKDKIEASAEVASEFRYREFPVKENDLFMAISQSGETADTLAALRQAKKLGMKTIALVNVPTSIIAREADIVLLTRAGPEISVASTKAFTSQVAALYSMIHGTKPLDQIPEKINMILKKSDEIKRLAMKYKDCTNFLFIGRGLNYPIALEGALKLKEITYIHAEGYPAGEMKHGPIAMVTPETGIVAIAVKDKLYDKMVSNISEVKARKGKVLAIATEGDEEIKHHATDIIYIPKIDESQYPLLTAVVMQLFAYYTADALGREIDRPRNLAKSVTVE